MAFRPHVFHPLATDQGLFIVNRLDSNTGRGGSFGLAHQLYAQGAFDPGEIALATRLVALRQQLHTQAIVALDCGANVGVHAISWAREIFPDGQVVAIEAQERVFYALAGNLLLNNVHNARAIWAAVGEAPGRLTVPVPDYLKRGSFGSFSLQAGKSFDVGAALDESSATMTVSVVRIDDLGLPRADFVKLDVEGMEIQALRGAQATIEAWKPVLLVEHIKSDRGELTGFLEQHGYRVFVQPMNLLCVHAEDPVLSRLRVEQKAPAARRDRRSPGDTPRSGGGATA